MTPSSAIQQISDSMMLVMILSMPPIIVASVVGILISLVQAITQVQEQTLPFAIKLIAVAATIAFTAEFLGGQILAFTLKMFDNFATLVG